MCVCWCGRIFLTFQVLISGSLRQRRWRQRPRSTPALLHHSSLDRYDGLTAIHSITAEAIVSISAIVLYCVRVCVHMSAETNQSCFLPFSPPLSSEPTLRGHDIGPELCFTLRSILSLSLSLPSPSLSFTYHRLPRAVRHRDSNSSWVGRSTHHGSSPKLSGRSQSPSITMSDSSLSLSHKKAKVGPGMFLFYFIFIYLFIFIFPWKQSIMTLKA